MRFGSSAQGRSRKFGTRGVAVVTTMLVAGLWAAPVAHASGPAIKVTPNAGLVSGQKVKVTGTGFFAGEDLIPLECPHGETDPLACDFSSLEFNDIVADSHGRFSTTFTVHRTLVTETDLSDCAPAGCDLVVADSSDPGLEASAALKFDPSVPLPKTSVTVTPSTGLGDRQAFTITGTGFTADRDVEALECVSNSFSCLGGFAGRANAAGHFSIVGSSLRYLTDLNNNTVDCAAAAGTCVMLAIDAFNADYHSSAPLTFDPNKPPPPPSTLTADPSDKLPYYAHVTLHGTHWGAGDTLLFTECPSASDTLDCFGIIGLASVGADGTFSTDQIVTRKIPDVFGGKAIDCAKRDCVVSVQDFSQAAPVSVPIAFDPNAPIPPKPKVTVTPAGPYTDRQVVTVNGHSFAPKALFTTTECFSSDTNGVFGCFGSKQPPQTTDAHGNFSAQVTLHRTIKLEGAGTVACTDPSVTCTLETTSEGNIDIETPLTFSASAAATAAPATAAWSARRSGWASTLSDRALLLRSGAAAQWLRLTSKAQGLR